MPLKHAHETRLVFLLGLAIVLAGVVCAVLPPLPGGIVPWVGAFIVSLIYPALLSPTLRSNRADNTFRRLHWFPAGMLLLWFVLQGGALFFAELAFTALWYTWGWTLAFVALGFFFLVFFCLKVIRQRGLRIFLLALLFVPFATSALIAEQKDFDLSERATAFWNERATNVLALLPSWGSGSLSSESPDIIAENGAASSLAEGTNLDPSEDPGEERWRASLRALKERMDRVQDSFFGTGSTVDTGTGSGLIATETEPDPTITDTETDPTHLPESGMGIGFLVITLLGGYSATMHGRARKLLLA
jgi:hypothetical protein